MQIREFFTVFFLIGGFFFLFISVVGILRLKDFYSRIHAAALGESVGLVLCSFGLFLYEGLTFTGIKILGICIAVFIASPIGTHILGRVAFKQGVEIPQTKEKGK